MKKYFKICTMIVVLMLIFAFPILAYSTNSANNTVKEVKVHQDKDEDDDENDDDEDEVDDEDEDDDSQKNKPEWVIEKNKLKLEKENAEDKFELLEDSYEDAIENNNIALAESLKVEMIDLEKQIVKIKDKINQIKLFYKGKEVKSEITPVIKDGRVLIPLRALAEVTGATVTWNQDSHSITVSKDDRVIVIPIGETYVEIDGSKVQIDVPTQLIDNRTVVPVRFVSEHLNQQVNWDSENKSVDID